MLAEVSKPSEHKELSTAADGSRGTACRGREWRGAGSQGIAGGQEAEAPAQEPSRNKMPVDLVMGSTLPE